MRKRWKISANFGWCLFAVWGVGWMPIYFTLVEVFNRGGLHGHDAPAIALIFIAIWFGVLLVPAALVGLFAFARLMWRERPRRVVEPVTTDLREHERGESQ